MNKQEKAGRKLAAAAAAIIKMQSQNDADWDDADDALNEAVFNLMVASPIGLLDFAMYLVEAGVDVSVASDFADTSVEHLQRHIAASRTNPNESPS